MRHPRCANPWQGKNSKGWRRSVQEEEPGKCKSTTSSEKKVIFKLQWKRKQLQRTNHSPSSQKRKVFCLWHSAHPKVLERIAKKYNWGRESLLSSQEGSRAALKAGEYLCSHGLHTSLKALSVLTSLRKEKHVRNMDDFSGEGEKIERRIPKIF